MIKKTRIQKKYKFNCKFCDEEFNRNTDSFDQNPFCNKCLPQRLENAKQQIEKERGKFVEWKDLGNGYSESIYENDLKDAI